MNLFAASLAVMIVSFDKGGTPSDSATNWKHLLAFFFSCLTMSLLVFGLGYYALSVKHYYPVRIEIRSNIDVHDIVTAIQSVHRTDLQIKTVKDPFSGNLPKTILSASIGFMLLTGLVMFFYKLYCRWLGIVPRL